MTGRPRYVQGWHGLHHARRDGPEAPTSKPHEALVTLTKPPLTVRVFPTCVLTMISSKNVTLEHNFFLSIYL